MEDPAFVIELDGVSNNKCTFQISLLQDGSPADPEVFSLEKPVFDES